MLGRSLKDLWLAAKVSGLLGRHTSTFSRFFSATLIGLVVTFVVTQAVESAWGADQGGGAFAWLARVRMVPGFADLRWFTAFSECGVDLRDFYEGRVPGCDVYGRPDTANPPFSVWLPRLMGVGYRHTEFIGVGLVLGFISLFIAQVFLLVCRPWSRFYAVASCLLSLPFLLAAERGSTDLVVYLLMALLAFSLASTKYLWRNVLAPAVALLAILVKIYPVFGVFGWIVTSRPWSVRNAVTRPVVVLQACAAVLGICLLAPWLHFPRSAPLPAGDFLSHALAPAFSDYFRPYFSQGSLVSVVKIFSLLASACLALRLGLFRIVGNIMRCRSAESEPLLRRAFAFHSLAFFSWLGCYVLTSSYDYRLIFLFPGLVCLMCACEFAFRCEGCNELRVYLVILLFLWPLVVMMPLFHAAGLLLPAWLDALVWWSERASDTMFIPFLAGGMIVMAARPVLGPEPESVRPAD